MVKVAKIINILFCKVKIFDVFDHLLQTGTDSECAATGIVSVKHVKNYGLIRRIFKITLHHGKFIKIR